MRGGCGYVLGFKSAHVLVLISLIHASEDSKLIQAEAEIGTVSGGVERGIDESCKLAGPSPDELFVQAQSLQQQGQLERAIELYGLVIESMPERAEAYYKRANALNGLGRRRRLSRTTIGR